MFQAMSGVTTQYLQRPEGRIAYEDRGGNGPLVIALPSLGDVRQEYRFLAPRLTEAGYRVVLMDLRGLGESSVGWSSYSADAVGGDLLALIEALRAGPALVIGTSMAAGAAAWAAAEQPDRVAGLVLVGPVVRDVPVSAVQTLMYRTLLMRPWGVAAWGIYYKSLYPTKLPADFAAYRTALLANLREPGRFAATQALTWASKAAVDRRLAAVKAPVLVVVGSKDPDFSDPAAEARLVAERLRGTVAIIAGAGHYPHAEMPEQTAAQILPFFSGLRVAEAVGHGR